VSNPFQLTAAELQAALKPALPLFPELDAARADLAAMQELPGVRLALAKTEPLMADIQAIPHTTYTRYRCFLRTGDRDTYEEQYFRKRHCLSAAALRLFLGRDDLKDLVQDYIWNICEETNWVLPAHERRPIDLFSAETGFLLAETLALLGPTLDGEVRSRVRTEIERRIFLPYLLHHEVMGWYRGGNNWNGVCNSSIAATFLWLEPEGERVAEALAIALAGLDYFLDAAFESDGSSTEGVGYWQYGLMNFIALAEMLAARSGGELDLLGAERVRRIAAYPARMLLSGSSFASFSDCHETVDFNPGIIARLAARTGEDSLFDLLAKPVEFADDWRLPMMLRNAFWWDGSQRDAGQIGDAVLEVGATARLTARTPAGLPIVLAIKAGHNAENHNQNDIGSFLVHVDGENLLTDPGPGLYSRFYFGPQRYENIFANSYGHSVPRIGGQLQGVGREFAGQLVGVETAGPHKRVQIEFARAYPAPNLTSLRRQATLAAAGEEAGTVWLEDAFAFAGQPTGVEEAFVTWGEVEVAGGTALIRGERHSLRLTIETPAGAAFRLERLEEASKANLKPEVLKRLTVALPPAVEIVARVRMETA